MPTDRLGWWDTWWGCALYSLWLVVQLVLYAAGPVILMQICLWARSLGDR
jgi:hypothetical protein